MAVWTGHLETPIVSDRKTRVFFKPSPFADSGVVRDAAHVDTGSWALRVYAGSTKDIFVVCGSGSRTISARVYSGSSSGKCGIVLYDPDNAGEAIDSDWSASSGVYEDLSITFTALSKVYILRLINATLETVEDGDAWYDNVVVS
jgi:hypothetical protein